VLDLAERAFEAHLDAVPDPRVFERYLVFRWVVRGGRGRQLPIEDPALFDLEDLLDVEPAMRRLVAPPQNVRIITTSNRRHLLPERVSDNRGVRLGECGYLHVGASVDEKLALSDRFGLVIGFYAFHQVTYLEIVDHCARRADISTRWDLLRERALRWALRRSSRSGRTAKQFVGDLVGREALEGG
jgi:predicted AAA+ superfamily ATPase